MVRSALEIPMSELSLLSLPVDYRALVVGASGSIGAALAAHLLADPRCGELQTLSRSQDSGFDLCDEASVAAAAARLGAGGAFDLILDATGALTIDGVGPEKRLASLDPQALMRSLQVNAVGPALVMKHFFPLLPRDRRSIFATLSARVGSIADNYKGGWWSYRAAKAALNQLLQTSAIEASRSRPQAVFAALQPGTVRSALSAPFAGGHDVLEPAESAARLLQVLDSLQANGRAHFVDHQGQAIPW